MNDNTKKMQFKVKMKQNYETTTSQNFSELLVRVASEQDKTAFSELFLHFAPRVKSYMMKLGSDETMSEELAQQALLQIWRKAKLFDSNKAAASTWIFRIARNLRIDSLRKEKHFLVDDFDLTAVPDDKENQEDLVRQEETAFIVRDALSELSVDQETVLRLSFYDGLSHADIANKLELPLGTVKSRIRLAFSRLRTTLNLKVGEMI
jgi:RNA polymerase sigma-70 factor (ECF subfamily)